MIKNKLKLILIISLLPLLSYCGGVKDALEGQKRSEQSDEFLVKKKNPLQMPPDINKLPTPGGDMEINGKQKNDEVKELLKIKQNSNSSNSNDESDLLNKMKEKIQ